MFTIDSVHTLPLELLVLDPSLMEEPIVDCVNLMFCQKLVNAVFITGRVIPYCGTVVYASTIGCVIDDDVPIRIHIHEY